MLQQRVSQALKKRREDNQYRQPVAWQSRSQMRYQRAGRPLVNFCSNDYLGLSTHPKVQQAHINALNELGGGAGSAHLVTGHSVQHDYFECQLAEFLDREKALLFSSGYIANVAALDALTKADDGLFSDELNHASLIDGCRISKAQTHRYSHSNLSVLAEKLQGAGDTPKFIVTDGIFSMDGDAANLQELVKLKQQYGAALMVDDAHGFAALGKSGKGSIEQQGADANQIDILTVTLGKALGGSGAAILADKHLIEYLHQFARGYVFSTATPPAQAVAMSAALTIVATAEGAILREKLNSNREQLAAGLEKLELKVMPSESAIFALVLGDEKMALNWSEKLNEAGYWVSAIRPPTVPDGTARLRITVTATHTEQQIADLIAVLERFSNG